MNSFQQYTDWVKPSFAPPSWIFGPVWTVLYILIAISYGYVGYLWYQGKIGFLVVLPFILNLVFNFLFTYLQFSLGSLWLASVDIVLVLGTLIWALVAIYPHHQWVSYINIPYLLWVSFATVLQISILVLNQ